MALTTAEFMKKWTGQDMPNPKRLPWFDEMKADLEEMMKEAGMNNELNAKTLSRITSIMAKEDGRE